MTNYVRSGAEFVVNRTHVRSQAQSDTGRLANGNFIVAWIDADFNTTAGRFIRAQMFQPDGTPVGDEVTLVSASSMINPSVSGLAGGGFVVTWEGMFAIQAQLFNADGSPVGVAFDVSAAAASSTDRPEVVALSGGGFAVTWHDSMTTGADTTGSGVRVRTYDANGVAIGAPVLVNTSTAGNQADASISALPYGGYVVTWTDRGASGGWLIKGRIFDAAGTPVGGEITLNAADGYVTSVESSVTTFANGSFAVAWHGNAPGESSAHRIQVFAADGTPLGSQIVAPANLSGTQVGPVLTALSDGGFVLAWTGNWGSQSDGSGRGIFVQVYDANAEAVGEPVLVNTQANGDQLQPSVVALDDGAFVVSWTDLNDIGADDDEVRAQIFVRAPEVEITSAGGGQTASFVVQENGASVTQVTAASPVAGATLTFGITGGADAALFSIDPATGALAFIAPPDFEAAGDVGANNSYEVVVSVHDGSTADSQAITVTVANVVEGVAITSNGGGDTASVALDENNAVVGVIAAEATGGLIPVYAISGGADAALFEIDATTGALRFVGAPDFERPIDADRDNVYDVSVSATAGDLNDVQALAVSIVGVNEGFGAAWADGQRTIAENSSFVDYLWAPDLDGDAVTYSITGGADAMRFTIDAASGALQFVAAPDYEAGGSAAGTNLYLVRVTASDGSFAEERVFGVTVNNVAEGVRITSGGGGSSASLSVSENARTVTTVAAIDGDNDAIVYRIIGGADGAQFAINAQTGALTFIAAPNFEAPTDADGDNFYQVVVSAGDGMFDDTQALTVRVNDVREGRTVYGSSYGEVISPTASRYRSTEMEDTIYASGGNDTIYGAGGNDRIDGGSGDDVLIGGRGFDELTGGTGYDRFVFETPDDSAVARPDVIRDFSRGQDRIDLSRIDADSNFDGNQSFKFIGNAAFSGVAGELRWEQAGSRGFVSGDVDGDGVADFTIQVDNVPPLTPGDFFL